MSTTYRVLLAPHIYSSRGDRMLASHVSGPLPRVGEALFTPLENDRVAEWRVLQVAHRLVKQETTWAVISCVEVEPVA